MAGQSLYPRTVSISRHSVLAGGNIGYRSAVQSDEMVVLTGLPANIQYYVRGPTPLAGVPADAVGRTLWKAFIPIVACAGGGGAGIAVGSIHRDDIMTDDLRRRFRLNEVFWGEIDAMVEAELLRA